MFDNCGTDATRHFNENFNNAVKRVEEDEKNIGWVVEKWTWNINFWGFPCQRLILLKLFYLISPRKKVFRRSNEWVISKNVQLETKPSTNFHRIYTTTGTYLLISPPHKLCKYNLLFQFDSSNVLWWVPRGYFSTFLSFFLFQMSLPILILQLVLETVNVIRLSLISWLIWNTIMGVWTPHWCAEMCRWVLYSSVFSRYLTSGMSGNLGKRIRSETETTLWFKMWNVWVLQSRNDVLFSIAYW